MPITATIKITIPPALKHISENPAALGADFADAFAKVGSEARGSILFHDRTGKTRDSVTASVSQAGNIWTADLRVGTVAGSVFEYGMDPQTVTYRRKRGSVTAQRAGFKKELFLRATMRKARAEFLRALRARIQGI